MCQFWIGGTLLTINDVVCSLGTADSGPRPCIVNSNQWQQQHWQQQHHWRFCHLRPGNRSNMIDKSLESTFRGHQYGFSKDLS